MARTWTSTPWISIRSLAVGCLVGGAACRPAVSPATQPETPQLEVQPGPPPPSHGLPMVDLAVSWEPPRIVAGDLDALRDALAGHAALELLAQPRLVRPERRDLMVTLLDALAPQTKVALRSVERDDSFGPEPFTVELETNGSGGAPRYGIPTRTWNAAPVRADGARLLLAEAPMNVDAWRALPSHTVGSCQPVVDALALSQEQALAFLEAFLDHADEALMRQFRAVLSVGLPQELEQWQSFRDAPEHAGPEQRCGGFTWHQLSAFSTCLDPEDGCSLAPRMILIGGARVGMPALEYEVPRGCDTPSATASRERIEAMAAEATAVVTPQLEREWTVLADRLGALTELYDALEDVCTPRRRRFVEADLEGLRERVARIGRLLGQDVAQDDGRWRVGTETVYVPGLGQVRELSRFEASPGTAAVVARADALALRRFALSRALCRSGYGELPLAAAVLDATGLPRFFGFFYEEELFCAGLSPAVSPAASTDASR